MQNMGMNDLDPRYIRIEQYEFKPGMKVINDWGRIGEVIKITRHKQLIHVDYGTFTQRYSKNGQKFDGHEIESIRPATEDDIREIKEREIMRECMRKIKENLQRMTYEEAVKILEILDKKSLDELLNM